jgi:Ca-activated chloride channel family protein
MSFIWPWMLTALLLVPLGIAAYVAIGRRRRAHLAISSHRARPFSPPSRAGRIAGIVSPALTICALVLIVLSLARPQAVISVPRLEGTVILAIDVSASMAADDVQPSRLELAKAIARELVEQRPAGVVMGIVAFGDSGLSVQVPTRDGTALERAIGRLAPSFGTSLGEGVLAALDTIARQEAGTPVEYYSDLDPAPSVAPEPVAPGSRDTTAVVLLSDGENTAPPEPAEVAVAAAQRGVPIHTVALGTTAGTTLDLDGFSVHTRLDEALLRRVAEVTAGRYLVPDPDVMEPGEAIDPDDVYGTLRSELVSRDEHLEVTSVVAGSGIALLVAAVTLSLLLRGRLP